MSSISYEEVINISSEHKVITLVLNRSWDIPLLSDTDHNERLLAERIELMLKFLCKDGYFSSCSDILNQMDAKGLYWVLLEAEPCLTEEYFDVSGRSPYNHEPNDLPEQIDSLNKAITFISHIRCRYKGTLSQLTSQIALEIRDDAFVNIRDALATIILFKVITTPEFIDAFISSYNNKQHSRHTIFASKMTTAIENHLRSKNNPDAPSSELTPEFIIKHLDGNKAKVSRNVFIELLMNECKTIINDAMEQIRRYEDKHQLALR